jgi:hypothetical protein
VRRAPTRSKPSDLLQVETPRCPRTSWSAANPADRSLAQVFYLLVGTGPDVPPHIALLANGSKKGSPETPNRYTETLRGTGLSWLDVGRNRRMFDTATVDPGVLAWNLDRIAGWRERGGQQFEPAWVNANGMFGIEPTAPKNR